MHSLLTAVCCRRVAAHIRQRLSGPDALSLQVEGCQRSLLKEKHYFRRYRCCKEHSRAPLVTIDGETKRFCQQCCCFHNLEAFDGDRRSCTF